MGYHLQSRKTGGSRIAEAGRGLPGHSSQKATVEVLAGRNPALPGATPQWPRVSSDFPHVKKRRICENHRLSRLRSRQLLKLAARTGVDEILDI